MARFEFDMPDIAGGLDRVLDVTGTPAFNNVLERAGGRLAEYFRGKIATLDLRDTDELIDSVKPTQVKITKSNEKYVDVYPQGTRKERGTRNAEVGFTHEYGTSKHKATHWMSDTVDDVGEEIADIIADGVLSIIDKQIGG